MYCNGCDNDLEDNDFSWKDKLRGKRSSRCKRCHSSYVKLHYKKNAKEYKERASKLRPSLIQKGKEFILSYLKDHPCVACGESDISVLQFDHVDPIRKNLYRKRVGNFVGSFNLLKLEISKCEVRCANCHMRKTGAELNWRAS